MIDDLTLLRRFEPALTFTQGEMFFPMAVDGYLRGCSLWLRDEHGQQRRLADVGQVSTQTLGRLRATSGVPYLRYVQRPMDLPAFLRWRRDPERPAFEAVGRWARVGLAARLLDAGYDAVSALRGQVPGGTTAVAELQYRQVVAQDPDPVYYGRVIRDGGYTVLHYLFFYAMNDFRSSFYGVNDHEADWEQVLVYVVEDDEAPDDVDRVRPAWLAYASHDLSGADLRRRWDDPEVRLIEGTHPVVHVAAGSHAGYVSPGEYLFGVEPPLLATGQRFVAGMQRLWRETLRQGVGGSSGLRHPGPRRLSIPFVDYARGDGARLGPGGTPWRPQVLTGAEPWVETYRGLWGLDTRDPLGGERAPAGPKFDRHGQPRLSWYDPLGFCGLDLSGPPAHAQEALRLRLVALAEERSRVSSQAQELRRGLRAQELDRRVRAREVGGDLGSPRGPARGWDLGPDPGGDCGEVAVDRERARRLLRRRSEIDETLIATRAALEAARRGDPTDPRAHLRHAHTPLPQMDRLPLAGELWAATSGGLLLLLLGVLPALGTPNTLLSLVAAVAAVFGVDAVVRGQGIRYALGYAVTLAVISAVVLLVEYWQFALGGGVALLVASTVRDNVRELRSLRHRASGARGTRSGSDAARS
jgi:hypothetical protein